MAVHWRETRLNGEGTCALFFNSSHTNPLAYFPLRTVLGLVSPTTLFRCGTPLTCGCPIRFRMI